jgi:hypothetical protein
VPEDFLSLYDLMNSLQACWIELAMTRRCRMRGREGEGLLSGYEDRFAEPIHASRSDLQKACSSIETLCCEVRGL